MGGDTLMREKTDLAPLRGRIEGEREGRGKKWLRAGKQRDWRARPVSIDT